MKHLFSENRLIHIFASDLPQNRGLTAAQVQARDRAAVRTVVTTRQNIVDAGRAQDRAAANLNSQGLNVSRSGVTGSRGTALVNQDGSYVSDRAVIKAGGITNVSAEQKRNALRLKAEGELIAAHAKAYNDRLASGNPMYQEDYEYGLNTALSELRAKFGVRDQKNAQFTASRNEKRKDVTAPVMPITRSQRLGLKPFGNRRSAAGIEANATGKKPIIPAVPVPPKATTTTTPTPEPTTETTTTPPSGESRKAAVLDLVNQGNTDPATITDLLNYDEQGNLKGDFTAEEVAGIIQNDPMAKITSEETKVLNPVLDALDKRTSSMADMLDKVTKLLEQKGIRLDDYTDKAELRNEQVKGNIIKQADDTKVVEDALLETSTEQRRRDELEEQRYEDQQYQSAEDRLLQQNIETTQRMQTSLGARYGGFGSGAGLRKIDSARIEGERLHNDLVEARVHASRLHQNKLDDITNDLRTGKMQIILEHDAKVTDAKNTALQVAQSIDDKELAEEDQITNDAIGLLKETFTKMDAISKETGEALSANNRNILNRYDTYKAEVRTQQQDLLNRVNTHLNTYGNTNASGLKGLIKQMTALGMDTSYINPDAPTLAQINKLNKSVTDTAMFDETGKHVDNATGIDLVSILDGAAMGIQATLQDKQRQRGLQLLQTGKTEQYKNHVLRLARESMTSGGQTDIIQKERIITGLDDAISAVSQDQNNNLGVWQALEAKAKSGVNIANDPDYVALVARISIPLATIRKDLFGSALTETEKASAAQFLPDPTTENVLDSLTKMTVLRNSWDSQITDSYDFYLGTDGAYKMLKSGNINPVVDESRITDWNQFYQSGGSSGIQSGSGSTQGARTGSGTLSGASEGALGVFASAHADHEGYARDPNAVTITEGNNPGALKYLPHMGTMFGATKGKNNFAIFPDEASGLAALEMDITSKVTGNSPALQRYLKSKGKTYAQATLQDYTSVYAPTSDGNDPRSYANALARTLSAAGYPVTKDTLLSDIAPLIA